MLRRRIVVGEAIVTETRETTAVALDKACSRLSDALERIVDGLEKAPGDDGDPVNESEELSALRDRVAALEDEIETLRAAGRNAADGIGETIAALEAARR